MTPHAHPHGHDHHHAHAAPDFGRAFAIGIVLNAGFVVLEAVYGVIANSTALLADAGHNLSDVLGLVVAWTAFGLSKRAPTARFTYGLRGSSILAALFNAMFLLVAVGAIGWEAVLRFLAPEPITGTIVMLVAAAGIVVNGTTALLFAAGRRNDINIQGAFLHMAADAGVSLGVVAGALIIGFTGWLWLDPAISLVICGVILWSTWGLLRGALSMSLDAVPVGVDPQQVRTLLESRPGVASIHDLHIWPISTTETALTCHLVMLDGHPGDAFLVETCHELAHRFSIGHSTLQIETSAQTECALRPDEVV